ncbi:YugN family protein [Cohnella thermotolerans]|uniref:YugN family protein n=1 Tax=Cohnella thermotolerans TaxID=329858 RepID=UPI0003F7C8BA|nr:YugN family protein [Cohnella thermotolerans]
MYPLNSRLTNQEQEFVPVRSALAERGFALGGSWDYDHGSFDCALDEANKVWLRLPFRVTNGNLDSETPENDAKIRFDQPYVLKHIYNEGLDAEAQPRTMGALFDQFQDPVDADAEIEPHWIDKARERLREAEAIYPA